MAYEMKTDGMEDISKMLENLEDAAPRAASRALYRGAGVMRDEIARGIEGIRTAPFKFAKSGETRLPSPEEKAVLQQAGVGIAKFDKNGTEVGTSVGFSKTGYADVNWKHMSSKARTNYKAQSFKGKGSMTTSTLKFAGEYQSGQQNQKPVAVIANAINSGTSFMSKQPFIRKAAKSGENKAVQAMREVLEAELGAAAK